MKPFSIILAFLATIMMSCSGDKPNATINLRDSIKHTDQIFVYEGLPHQMFESELLKVEKERKDTVIIADYPFYTPKVQIDEKTVIALKAFISDSKNFTQFTGEKKCGGFHPDYAVVWSFGDKNYSVLFCYGCSEVKICDGDRIFRYDVRITDELKKVLAPFQLKRPKKNG